MQVKVFPYRSFCLTITMLLLSFATLQAQEMKVFSVNGVKDVLVKLGADFQATTGTHVQFTFGTIGALEEKMRAGDIPDVLVAISPAIAKAEQQGTIVAGSGIEVGRTGMGVAVKTGAATPDISTLRAFRNTVLKAASLAYSDPRTGAASGVAFAKVLNEIGIAEQVRDKTVLVAGGSVGELVAQERLNLASSR